MTKRLQNRISEGRYTLPVVALYAVIIWLVCGLIHEQWWIQFACFIVSTYLVIELNNSNMLIRIYSKMVSSSFLVLTTAACFMFGEIRGTICQMLMIASYLMMFRTYQDSEASGSAYYAFLCIGLASMANAQVLIYIPVLWILMAALLRSMSLRTFGASLFGIITPYWMIGAYYIYNGSAGRLFERITEQLTVQEWFDYSQLTMQQVIMLAFVSILAMTGSIHYVNTHFYDKIRTRMIFYGFISMSLLSLLVAIAIPQWYDMAMRMLIVHTSPLIAHFFALTKTRITNIAFCLIVAVAFGITGYNIWMAL